MITCRQSLVFPFIVRGTLLVIAVIFYLTGSPFYGVSSLSVNLVSVSILIIAFTTRNQMDVDTKSQTMRSYVWLLGMKFGGLESYSEIEKIFVNRINSSSSIEYPIRSVITPQSEDSLFKSFIKIDGEKYPLTSDWKKERLITSGQGVLIE